MKMIEDVNPGEEIVVLQPDKTWKKYKGEKFELPIVYFKGNVFDIAEEIQKLRDQVELDNSHASFGLPVLQCGMDDVILGIFLHVISREHGIGPLMNLKKVIIDEVVNQSLVRIFNFKELIIEIIENKTSYIQDDLLQKSSRENIIQYIKLLNKYTEIDKICPDFLKWRT